MKPIIGITLLAAIATAAPTAARPLFGTGPLCADSKGLAKPCPPRNAKSAARAKSSTAPNATMSARTTDQPEAATANAAPARPTSPPRRKLFGLGRLCRDSKGLAKPCGG